VAVSVLGGACGGGGRPAALVPSPVEPADVIVPGPAAGASTAAAAAPVRPSAGASRPKALKTRTPAGGRSAAKLPASPRPARPTAAPSRAPAKAKPAIDTTALELAVTRRLDHEPLARAIARRTPNPNMADRAASAVTREAGRLGVSPSLLAAVLLIENRQLDTAAVSSQGAVGLMQVMPMHAGGYGCNSDDLRRLDANICHGASILHLYLRRTRSVAVALRRYNGCVRGVNTPRCERYPVQVLRTAARVRRDILASASPADRNARM
jgi:soluble lytic murein transglycosylase-like protein